MAQAQPMTPPQQLVPVQEDTYSQIQNSPLPRTANGSPLPLLVDAEWGFEFQDVTKAATPGDATDPLQEFLPLLAAAGVEGMCQLMKKLYVPDLFVGLENEKAVYKFVLKKLHEIARDTQTHVQVGDDPSFSLRCMTTVPHKKAIDAVAKHNGWAPEAVHQGFCVNVGWVD
jgi:hypothetical protein